MVGSCVELNAREDSWVAISADSRQIMEATLAAAAEKSIGARDQVVIKTANAGSLDISFNGRKLPAQGAQRGKNAHFRLFRRNLLELRAIGIVFRCRSLGVGFLREPSRLWLRNFSHPIQLSTIAIHRQYASGRC